jgi:transposase
MPRSTVFALPQDEQTQMLAALRRARYGSRLALHILLLCAAGRSPTEIAVVLFCSRSSVYCTVRGYHAGTLALAHDDHGRLAPPVRTTVLLPTLRRSLVALLKAPPRASGWCRTRWSCATLALTLQTKRGITVSAETMRRWLHELGWVWKRAKLVAKDDDPQRVNRLARIRWVCEQLKHREALVFADELDIHLWPKVGCAWMPQGTQLAVMTPGQHQKHSRAGALDLTTGTLLHCLGARKTNALFRDLLGILEASYPAERYTRLYVVVDNYKIHKAKAVEQWLASHPRVTLLLLPTYCPRANPIERAFGDVHDCCTRTHRRTRLPALVADVEEHLHVNGPWPYTSCPKSTMSPRSPWWLRKSPQKSKPKVPPECTNRMWPDLVTARCRTL